VVMSNNLVHELNATMGLSLAEIGQGLEARALAQQTQAQQADARELSLWTRPDAELPDWVRRAAALWVIEFWLNERDSCGADQLLKVDEKYTRLLRGFSMGEIIAMRNQLMQTAGQ
jgi:hypothetical protein